MADGGAHEGSSKALWLLALLAAGLGAGALLRYPLLTSVGGITFLLLYGVALAVVALPVVLGEAALGQFRRRNVIDSFGVGPWRAAGFVLAFGALLTAVLVAVVGGWAGRLVVESFRPAFFDDPDRHIRLAFEGFDAVLGVLAVLGIATAAAMAGATKGLRASVPAVAVLVLVVLGGLTAWAMLLDGAGSARADMVRIDVDAIDGRLVVQAGLAALLPTLVGLGAVATLSSNVHDRTLPRDGVLLCVLLLLVPFTAGLFLTSLAAAEGAELAYDGTVTSLFGAIPRLFAELPDTQAGIVTGLFYGAIVAAAVVAIIVLLEVLAAWLNASFEHVTPARSFLAVGLLAYIVAVPFCFDHEKVYGLHLFLVGVVAPLGGLLASLHVGWVRPQVLDGFRVGDAHHQLDVVLRPYLRFVAPVLLAVLLLAGTMSWLDFAGLDRGTGGLWRIVP